MSEEDGKSRPEFRMEQPGPMDEKGRGKDGREDDEAYGLGMRGEEEEGCWESKA